METHQFRIGNQKGELKYIATKRVQDLDDPIRKGIEAIFEFSNPPPKYIIAEVKTNTKGRKSWFPQLSRKKTASGDSQMTKKWIDHYLREFLSPETYEDILEKSYESILIGISKENPIIIKSLDKNARIIPDKLTQIN
ncbi:hypothetical protein [Flavobacterium sp. JP2137]|uniref:hypothetical protein n=1 Tax=Flavobacterium sp. JP2137 TaxID=3414510 RepID=UPI003D300BBB